MDNAQAIAAIIGLVNGVRLIKEKSWWGLAFYLTAMVAGIGFGFLHYFGLTIETGIVAALASSGFYRLGEKVGGQQ